MGWPEQAMVIVLETDPPFMASSRTRRRGVMKVNVPLVGTGPLKPMLLVVNWRHGAERYQALVPQSIVPLGY